MLPSLALFLCTAFVLFLLRLERKQTADISKALWVPTIWMLITASKPLGDWFQVFSTDPEQGSPLDLAFQGVLILVGIIILIRRDFDWSNAMRENAWLMALIIFMLLSMLWSDLPLLTLKRWGKEFLAVLMAFVVLSESSPCRAMECIIKRVTYILIPFSPVLIKYFPKYGRVYSRWSGEEMWTGVAVHKNSLACLCTISAAFLIWSLIRRRQGNNPAVWKYQTYAEILLLVLAFWLMGGPGGNLFYSATSVYALIAGLLVYGGYYLTKKKNFQVSTNKLALLVSGIIFFGTVSIFNAASGMRFFSSAAGRDATLTGRTQVWAALVPLVMKSPVVGRGFGVFWTPERQQFFQISGAHNGYLDVLLGLGLIGLFLVSAFYLSSCRKAHKELSHNFDWGVLWTSYIIMAVVHNIGESSIASFTTFITAVILFVTVSSTKTIRVGNRKS